MKKIFLVLMTVAIGTVAMATSDPSRSTQGMLVLREGSTFKLFYKAKEEGNVTVTIYDDANRVVFSESFKGSDGFIRPYNFAKLEQGRYTFELKDASGLKTQNISYEPESQSEKVAKVIQLPGTEKYALLVPQNGSKSMSVDIYDREGNSVYSRIQRVEGDYSRLFDLSGLETFTIVVSDSKGMSKTIRR